MLFCIMPVQYMGYLPPESSWKLDSDPQFRNFQKVEVTKTEQKPWGEIPVEVQVTLADGNVVTIAADTPFFTFTDSSLKKMTVSAAEAGHIDELHIKGNDAGSKFAHPNLEALMLDIEQKLPGGIMDNPGAISAFDMEMGKPMGEEGIAGLPELVQKGIILDTEVTELMGSKEAIFKENREGTNDSRKAFVEQYNAEHPGAKIQLAAIRGGTVIVPRIKTAKQPTTKLYVCFGPDGKGNKTMWTAAPGRYMPRHPIPDQFKDREGKFDEQSYAESQKAWLETAMIG